MESAFTPELIPYSADVEKALLGSLIISPSQMDEVLTTLKKEHFFILRHQYIYEALEYLHRTGGIDYLVLTTHLTSMGKLDEIGGPPYITELTLLDGTSLHAPLYAGVVKQAAIRRQALSAADKIKELMLDQSLPLSEALAGMEKHIEGIREDSLEREWKMAPELLSQLYDEFEASKARGTGLIGLDTGFPQLNDAILGWQGGDLVIIAGRPGMGKSAKLGQWTLKVCEQKNADGKPRLVVWFNQEMSASQLIRRIVSAGTKINFRSITLGNLSAPEEAQFLTFISEKGAEMQLAIIDNPSMNPAKMKTIIRQLERALGQKVDLIVEDYLQLLEPPPTDEKRNREQAVAAISRGLKKLARELDRPLISAAQISREVEKQSDKRPTLKDLRESGAIENDADIVMFLYADSYHDTENGKSGIADPHTELIIAKHRKGRTGTIDYTFDKARMQFIEWIKGEKSLTNPHDNRKVTPDGEYKD